MDRIIYRLEETNSEIEIILDCLNTLYYNNDTIEANLDSKKKCNNDYRKQDERPRIINTRTGLELTQPSFLVNNDKSQRKVYSFSCTVKNTHTCDTHNYIQITANLIFTKMNVTKGSFFWRTCCSSHY